MPEMHLKQPRFTYSACGSFTKNKKIIQKFKETGHSRYIYQNQLNKACFQHDMAHGEFKDFTGRTATDRTLHNKPFNIAKIQNMMDIYGGLASMIYKFFDKKTSGSGIKNKLFLIEN